MVLDSIMGPIIWIHSTSMDVTKGHVERIFNM